MTIPLTEFAVCSTAAEDTIQFWEDKDPSPISLINAIVKLGKTFLKFDLEEIAEEKELWKLS